MPFHECFNFQLWVINFSISKGTSKNIHVHKQRANRNRKKRWTIFSFSLIWTIKVKRSLLSPALHIHCNLVTDMKERKCAGNGAHCQFISDGGTLENSSKIEMSVGYWVVYVSILHNSIYFDIDLVSFFDIHSSRSNTFSLSHSLPELNVHPCLHFILCSIFMCVCVWPLSWRWCQWIVVGDGVAHIYTIQQKAWTYAINHFYLILLCLQFRIPDERMGNDFIAAQRFT